MIYTKLGKTGLEVSPIGMGCWAIGGLLSMEDKAIGWSTIDDNESIAAIRMAIDMGINLFDTADVYGAGHSETILAKALNGMRDKVILATKFGLLFDEINKKITGIDVSKKYIKSACNASLKRLSTDYIDIYQLHVSTIEDQEIFDVIDALEELVSIGKIRYYGWSTDNVENARKFLEGKHNISVQHAYNIFMGNDDIIKLCEENNLASLNRSPLAMGLLTGKFKKDSILPSDDVRGKNAPGWMENDFKLFLNGKPNPGLIDAIDAIKEILISKGRTIAQGAIGYIWGKSTSNIPIPGFKKQSQVKENAGSISFGPLDPKSVSEIDNIIKPFKAKI